MIASFPYYHQSPSGYFFFVQIGAFVILTQWNYQIQKWKEIKMNSNQEIKQENREIVLSCCWATYCSKASRRGIPPSSLMSLLASASSASWTMIQTYITQKGKFNLSVKFPRPSLGSCLSNVQTLHVCTDETSPKQILFLGRVSVYGGINITEFVPFFEQKIHGLFRDFQGHISQTKTK